MSDDGAILVLGGQVLFDMSVAHPLVEKSSAFVTLPQGDHPMVLESRSLPVRISCSSEWETPRVHPVRVFSAARSAVASSTDRDTLH